MCKTHSGWFSCGHKVVDIPNGCPTPKKCVSFLKKEYTIPEGCIKCKHGAKDTERDKLVMKKRRKVVMSHERVETADGPVPRECEMEVVPCTSGMEINFGLNKEKKKKAPSDNISGGGGSSWKLSSMRSLGRTSSEGSREFTTERKLRRHVRDNSLEFCCNQLAELGRFEFQQIYSQIRDWGIFKNTHVENDDYCLKIKKFRTKITTNCKAIYLSLRFTQRK